MLLFRKAINKDIKKVSEIYLAVIAAEEAGCSGVGWVKDIYPTRETAQAAFERGDLFVAEYDGVVCATAIINQLQVDVYDGAPWKYAAADHEVMVLHTLAVSPDCYGNGFGRAFVRFYESYALSAGCNFLRMDTNANNTKARKMYNKLGYDEIDVVTCSFNGIGGVRLVLLEKKL